MDQTKTLVIEDVRNYLKPGNKAHLIGVGGVGMSGLARVLKYFGLQVSGSDMRDNKFSRELAAEGIPVFIHHEAQQVHEADFVVYSSAITEKNPERLESLRLGIPAFRRADVLSALMNEGVSIGVTGTHGKTTTSSLISFLLTQAGYQPTCLVGGNVLNFGSNVVLGDKHLFVSEVDESDRTHLLYKPDFAVVTNLEEDHMDVYADFSQLKSSFSEFINNIKSTSCIIHSGHDEHLKQITSGAPHRVDYGLSRNFCFGAEQITVQGFKSQFRLYEHGTFVGTAELTVPGTHNVLNALAALAALRKFGVTYGVLLPLLPKFRGAGRRLEVKWDHEGFMIIDDYAHHPTEVKASLSAIKSLGKPTTVVFQPHRFSRTLYLGELFSRAFDDADRLILTDIYGANEENPNGIDIHYLYKLVKEAGHPNVRVIKKNEIINFLLAEPIRNGVVAFLGAGDIGDVASEYAARFKN